MRLIDLPYSIGAVVTLDEDGFASIYLNARQSYEKQMKNLRHELKHLQRDDMFNDKSIFDAEYAANIE